MESIILFIRIKIKYSITLSVEQANELEVADDNYLINLFWKLGLL